MSGNVISTAKTPWLALLVTTVLATMILPMASAADYQLDPDHTFPSLEFDHMGLSTWRGKFNKSTGLATYDPDARTGTVNVRIDASSIDFGLDSMNAMAVKPDWLDATRFPLITYTGRLVFHRRTPVAIEGQVTIRGISQPLTLTLTRFKCQPNPLTRKETCGADAEGELDRTGFGMTQFADGDAARIRLHIQAEAIRQDQATH